MAKNAKPAAFLHVGLGKCASTYLQQVWAADERYAGLNLANAMTLARNAAVAGQEQVPPQLNASGVKAGGKTLVGSSEGFTWGWVNDPARQAAIPGLQRISAKMLADTGLSDRVLVMVRNPVDWLRAAHEQSIKEGGCQGFAEFADDQAVFLRSVLDLEALQSAFAAHFKTVVILSADELRHDPETFWTRYEAELNARRPSSKALAAVDEAKFSGNTSLRERTALLARLNRGLSAVRDLYETLPDLPAFAAAERDRIAKAYRQSYPWATRRIAEFAPAERLEAVAGLAGPELEPEFDQVFVDDALGEHLEKRFFPVLEEAATIERDLVRTYRQEVENCRRENTPAQRVAAG